MRLTILLKKATNVELQNRIFYLIYKPRLLQLGLEGP